MKTQGNRFSTATLYGSMLTQTPRFPAKLLTFFKGTPPHPLTCPPAHLPTCPPVHLPTRSPAHPFTRPPAHPLTCPPVHPSTCPPVIQ